jgi:acetyl esterase/lipase
MNTIFRISAALAALLGLAPFIRPKTPAGEAILWVPKLLGGALSPLIAVAGLVAVVRGVLRRDRLLAGAGLLAAGLAARLMAETPNVDRELAGGLQDIPPLDTAPFASVPGQVPRGRPGFERDIVFGQSPVTGRALRADLWQPPPGVRPSGLGLIYAHGSGWRVGDKDLGTRPFFRRLAARGHVILDIAYTLWPGAGLPDMVGEVNQAIVWLKENGPAYGVRPDRIVLMGGSAGAHLALMAAYTPEHAAFRPDGTTVDTGVRGVIAFYPPVDLLMHSGEGGESYRLASGPLDRLVDRMLKAIFLIKPGEDAEEIHFENMIAQMLGGTADEIPETYELLSPIRHVCSVCPPTLLLQGSDDVFGLAPAVRRLHEALRAAGSPSVLIEFPHTEHGFDLLLPGMSPMARAATRAVVLFLARLE